MKLSSSSSSSCASSSWSAPVKCISGQSGSSQATRDADPCPWRHTVATLGSFSESIRSESGTRSTLIARSALGARRSAATLAHRQRRRQKDVREKRCSMYRNQSKSEKRRENSSAQLSASASAHAWMDVFASVRQQALHLQIASVPRTCCHRCRCCCCRCCSHRRRRHSRCRFCWR